MVRSHIIYYLSSRNEGVICKNVCVVRQSRVFHILKKLFFDEKLSERQYSVIKSNMSVVPLAPRVFISYFSSLMTFLRANHIYHEYWLLILD